MGWIPEKMRTAAHDIHAPLVLAALVAALAAAPARADYASRLDVAIDPSARSTPTALGCGGAAADRPRRALDEAACNTPV